ncbi:ABC transporter ATP-binding protein [Actinoplanes sp. NPDC051343]|uniref:ABC transporter ATP-binding protein n=1 Tax=Actinoplanes sp. NPDC051343 TaxID=3363906 RepID=UPI00379CC250
MTRSLLFTVRQCWYADRRGLIDVVVLQLAVAGGMAGALLLLRGLLTSLLSGSSAGGPGLGGSAGVGRLVAGMAVLVALGAAAGALQLVAAARQRVLGIRLDRHLIAAVLERSGRAGLADFEDPAFHDRLQRAVRASRQEPAMVVALLTALLQAALMVAAVAGIFVVMVWWLLPLTLLSALPAAKAARDERTARYGLHVALAENRRRREYYERVLSGRDDAKEVRALGLAGRLRRRWDAEYGAEVAETVAVTRTHLRLRLKARLVGDAVIGLVVGGVWWLVAAHAVTASTAATGLAALWLLSGQLKAAVTMAGSLGESVLYMADLRGFLDVPPTPGDPEPAVTADFAGLRAAHLSFTYPGESAPVLHDVSLTLAPGEIVALVGANGSGKTTLAKVLAGLYAPGGGTLLHGGEPVGDGAELRRRTAVVFQDYARYKLTARDNIAFGRPGEPADERRVETAARRAGAYELIRRLPGGYDTVLGREFTGGTDLSGGQWQRLALARAFYRDAPFVILDEPTASLDPQAEADLYARIRELFAGRTVLLITHRFGSVRHCDRIYVLAGGRVAEQGDHASLMDADAAYARLFRLQAAPYQAIDHSG